MKVELKVITRAPREKIVEKHGQLKAYVKAPPEKGRANKALMKLVARVYKVKKRQVRIISGETSRKKVLEIRK